MKKVHKWRHQYLVQVDQISASTPASADVRMIFNILICIRKYWK